MDSRQHSRPYANGQAGFTLVELLVVVGIIGLLSALVSANVSGARQKARDANRQSDLRTIQTALELYLNDHGNLPGPVGGGMLTSLAGGPNWIPALTPTYIVRVPVDPKNVEPFVYQYGSGQTVQQGAYYVQTNLETTTSSPSLTDPADDLTKSATFTSGTFIRQGATIFRLSGGPTNP